MSKRIVAVLVALACSQAMGFPTGPAPEPYGYRSEGIVNADFEDGTTGWSGWSNAMVTDFDGNSCLWLYSESMKDPMTDPPTYYRTGSASMSAMIQVPSNASFLRFVSHHSVASTDPYAYPYSFSIALGGESLLQEAFPPVPGELEAVLENGWETRYVHIPSSLRGLNTDLSLGVDFGGEEGRLDWFLDYVGFDPPGWTQINPVVPEVPEPRVFKFWEVRPGWLDPLTASGFRYVMTSSSLFTAIADFPTGFGPLTVLAGGQTIGTGYGPGDSVDFASVLGHGVSEFTILDIAPLVDPEDPMAFPLKLDFSTPTASFDMEAIPEPCALGLLVAGGWMAFLRRTARAAS